MGTDVYYQISGGRIAVPDIRYPKKKPTGYPAAGYPANLLSGATLLHISVNNRDILETTQKLFRSSWTPSFQKPWKSLG